MHHVYVLVSLKDENLYIGLSEDVHRRLLEHNKGRVKSTRSRTPFKLVYEEAIVTRREARKREKYLKSGIGREYLRHIIFRSSSVG